MEIKFFNSLTNEKEVFQPQDPKRVKIYSCGPTVYNFNHIGNFRSYMFVDILRRTLKLFGYSLDQTMNITDIDDKIISNSIKENTSIEEFTKKWIEYFFEDLETLNIEKVEHYPKATDSVEEMIDIIEKLKRQGLVYEKDGNIYYSIEKFKNYGKLSKIELQGNISGARYDADEYDKEDLRDFVLWKSPKLDKEKFWDTKFGKGRPGWHLECSAMIRKIYNSGIDIHTGGVDLLFPHHENEIAQTEGAFPNEKFVTTWLHCEHLLVENQKMSKSKGNFYTLRDLTNKNYNKKAIRYLLLSYHYRTKLNFSISRIEESEKAIQRIQNTLDRIIEENIPLQAGTPTEYAKTAFQEFLEGLSDDLNTPKSLASIFEFIKMINSSMDSSSLSKEDLTDCMKYFQSIDSVLGVLEFQKRETYDEKIENLIQKRIEAKNNKNFKLADEIRDELKSKGIIIEDTKTGVKWKKI